MKKKKFQGNAGKIRPSQLIAYLNAGDFVSAKLAAVYEEISFATEKTLLALAKHVSSVREIIRIIFKRNGFSGHQKEFRQYCEQLEAEIVLSRNWKKVKTLITDAPLESPALTAMVVYLYAEISNPEAAEVFKLYQQKYDFNKVVWPEDHREMYQEIVANTALKLS